MALSDNKIQFTIEVDGKTGEASVRQFGDSVDAVGKRGADAMGRTSAATEQLGSSLVKTGQQGKEAGEKTATATSQATAATQAAEAVVRRLAEAWAAVKIGDFVKDSVLAAARYETLGVVMTTVGHNAGYTGAQMEQFAKGLQASGISMEASRSSVIRLAQANIDLSKSAELGRAAQNAAVIANVNSSEAFNTISTAMATGQVILLHHLGIMANFEAAYKKEADALGKSKDELTENEKAHARLTETLRAAAGISGAYESSMATAGKQLLSMTRYVQDLMVNMGTPFLGVFSDGVKKATESLKNMNFEFTNGRGKEVLEGMASAASTALSAVSSLVSYFKSDFVVVIEMLGSAKAAQLLLNTAILDNPYVRAAGLVAAFSASLKEMSVWSEKIPGMFKISDNSLGGLAGMFKEATAAGKLWWDSMVGNVDPSGRVIPECEKIAQKILDLQEVIKKDVPRPWYLFQLFEDYDSEKKRIADAKAQIAAYQQQVLDANNAVLNKAQAKTDAENEEYQRVKGAKDLAQATERAAKANEDLNKKIQDTTDKYIPLKKEMAEYKAQLVIIAAAEDRYAHGRKDGMSPDEAAAARFNLYASTSWGKEQIKAQEEALNDATAAQERATKEYQSTLDSLEPLRVAQQQYNMELAVLDKAYPDHTMKAYADAAQIAKDKLDDATESVTHFKAIQEENEALADKISRYTMTDSERRIDDLRRIHEEMVDANDDLHERGEITQEVAAANEAAFGKKLQDDIKEVTESSKLATKAFDEVYRGIHEGAVKMFEDIFDGGASSFSNLADTIYSMFKKLLAQMATLAIAQPIIVPTVSSIGGVMGLSNTAIAKSLGMETSAISSAGTGMGAISSLFSSGGWTGLQNSVTGSLDNMGFSNAAFAIDDLSAGAFGSIAAGAGSLAMSLLSGKGLTAQTGLQAAGSALGAAFGIPGSIIGGLAGNLLGGLFGGGGENKFTLNERVSNVGSQFNAASGFSPTNYTAGDGGNDWYHPIENAYSSQIAAIQTNFNNQVFALTDKLPEAMKAQILGNLSTTDFNAMLSSASSGEWGVSEAESAISGVATKFSSSLVSSLGSAYATALSSYINSNGAEALIGNPAVWNMLSARVQQNISGLFTSAATTIQGGDVQGGIDSINSVTTAIAQISSAMAPIAEIIATNGMSDYDKQLRSINKQFDDYAASLSAAGVDLAKYTDLEKARAMALANVVNPAVAEAAKVAADAATAFNSLADAAMSSATAGLKASFAAEQSNLDAQHKTVLDGLNAQLKTAQDSVSKLTSLTNSLTSAINGMKLSTQGFITGQRAEAQATLQNALRAAQSGDFGPGQNMGNTLSVLSQSSESLFSSFEDYQRDYWKTYLSIVALNDVAGKQLSSEQTTVDMIQRQIDSENYWYSQETALLIAQLNALLGVQDAVLSIGDATAAFNKAKELEAAKTTTPTGVTDAQYFANKYADMVEKGQIGGTYGGIVVNSISDIMAVFAEAGLTPQSHYTAFGASEGLAKPSFAVGTDYVPYDMPANIHKGERIVPAAYNRSDKTNFDILEALRALREEIKAGNVENAAANKKTAKYIERWDGDGMPAVRNLT